MFHMSDLSTYIIVNSKIGIFPFNDTCLALVAPNPLDMLPKQNWVGKLTSPNIKTFFLWLSVSDDELLPTPKIIIFLIKSLPKFHDPAPLNAMHSHYVPISLYHYFLPY